MGLTYVELLSRIEEILENKFRDKFDGLFNEIRDAKKTHTDLIRLNKALISQNRQLRSDLSAYSDVDSDSDDVSLDNTFGLDHEVL